MKHSFKVTKSNLPPVFVEVPSTVPALVGGAVLWVVDATFVSTVDPTTLDPPGATDVVLTTIPLYSGRFVGEPLGPIFTPTVPVLALADFGLFGELGSVYWKNICLNPPGKWKSITSLIIAPLGVHSFFAVR